ncbi:MAG: hypothetical protein IKQ28_02155, partial [Lachnospiraceae bacterium]|nr:hypothetical protein [Lachnospiraceae bacterium]
MAKKVFAFFTDKTISEEDEGLLNELRQIIERSGYEARVMPLVDGINSEDALRAISSYEANAFIFAGAFGDQGTSAEIRQQVIDALSAEEKEEMRQVIEILDNNLLT